MSDHHHHEHAHTHDHGHSHGPGHSHHHVPSTINNAFIIGIILNTVFVLVEVAAGLWNNSLALLTDAGHNVGDVAGLVLVLIATRLAKRKSNKKFTYGYGKTTILVALINAGLLLIAVGAIGWEAITRFNNPHPVEGKLISAVAFMGIIINTISALLFMKNREKDLNVRGAYLHMAGDAAVSLGVMISGIVIYFTHWFWLDAAMSLVIIIVIVWSTWGLLKDSLRLSLDGVPAGIETEHVKKYLLGLKNVTGLHDLHIWAMSTNKTALTAHLVVPGNTDDSFLAEIKKELHHHFHIDHATIQVEKSEGLDCDQDC